VEIIVESDGPSAFGVGTHEECEGPESTDSGCHEDAHGAGEKCGAEKNGERRAKNHRQKKERAWSGVRADVEITIACPAFHFLYERLA